MLEEAGGPNCAAWCAEQLDEACACGEKTRRGEAMPTASLMVLEAGNSVGEETAVSEAAVQHVWKGNR